MSETTIILIALFFAVPLAYLIKHSLDDALGITGFMIETDYVEQEVLHCKDYRVKSMAKLVKESPLLDNLQKRGQMIRIRQFMLENNIEA